MLIDHLSHSNRWARVNPAEKGLFALGGLSAALLCRSPGPALLLTALMAALTVFAAGIRVRAYLRLLLLPAGFLLAGTLGLALTLADGGDALVRFGPWALSRSGLAQAALVFSRSLAAVSSLYLLALTTPMTGILTLLRRCRVPMLLIELAVLAYRQLFVFFEVARQMRLAQASRLGYAGYRNSLRSLGLLGAHLFARAHQRSRLLHRSLLARGYDGELRWLEQEWPLSRGRLLLAGSGAIVLVFLALTGGAG